VRCIAEIRTFFGWWIRAHLVKQDYHLKPFLWTRSRPNNHKRELF
jgi:hypothetical protein